MTLEGGATALARARFCVPSPTVPLVPRPRVLDLLDDAIAHPVALVTGGAGAGKSMAVADWARRRPTPGPVVWASLIDSDADERRLRATIAAAASLALGGDPAEAGADDDSAASFLSLLGERPVVVVLDDVHEIERGSAMALLESVTRHPPDGVHLVLISRHDPPLSLHRLRVSGRLGDVRAADLAFTADEAGQLFGDLDLPDAAVEHLLATTEGWAAGLRLAHMALAAAEDPAQAAFAFDGHDSRVAAYLMDEMRTLDDERQQLLLTTCVADEVSAPFAIALSGNPAAGSVLEALADDDLFMVRRGVGRYRLHQLVLQSLRARLRATDPELEAELHRRAARWFEGQGAWLEALCHAVQSRDWPYAGRLAVRSAAVALYSSQRNELFAVLDRIPAETACGRPELEIALAYAEYGRSELGASALYLQRAEEGLARLPEPRAAVATVAARLLQAIRCSRLGDAHGLLVAAQEAETLLGSLDADDAPGWVANRGIPTGLRAVGELWSGRPRRAAELMERSIVGQPSKVVGFSAVYWHGLIALAEASQGFTGRAIEQAERALDEDAAGWARGHEAAPAWLALATAELWRGDAVRAQEYLERSETANGQFNQMVMLVSRLMAARIRVQAGELSAARQILADLEALLAGVPPTSFVAASRTAALIDLELASGALERATSVLATLEADRAAAAANEPAFDHGPIEALIAMRRGRILLASGHEAAVRAAVEPLLSVPGGVGAQAWLLVCLGEDALRHDAYASDALAHSLAVAAPEGLASLFANPGARLEAMLRRHLDVDGSWRPFVEQALARSGHAPLVEPGGGDHEPLTERELSVLAYLPTLRSNSEIADGLGISVNTVKQHLKSIHRKLGVGTRRDAVRVAQRVGLLSRSPTANWE